LFAIEVSTAYRERSNAYKRDRVDPLTAICRYYKDADANITRDYCRQKTKGERLFTRTFILLPSSPSPPAPPEMSLLLGLLVCVGVVAYAYVQPNDLGLGANVGGSSGVTDFSADASELKDEERGGVGEE
jgi:hypothetical protein